VAKLDPRLAPAYSIAQAAHYLKIPAPTVRSWVLGRDYPRQSGKGRFKPVVVTPVDPDHRLSFRNLIEMAALRALRTEHEFKLSAVRTALDYAGQELAVTDLLASKAYTPARASSLSSATGNSSTSIEPVNSVFRQCCKAYCAEFNGTRVWQCASFRHCRADRKPNR